MASFRVTLCVLLAVVYFKPILGQELVDMKRIPKRITKPMCECADVLRTDERDAKRRAAQNFCSAQQGLVIPDFETEVKEEVRKKLPRGLAQWARKQVEAEGVDYKCLNKLREFYFFQRKIEQFVENLPKPQQEAYADCFGKQMKWLNPVTGEIDKAFIRTEIAGSQITNPQLRQSLELLSLTCRGKDFNDLESYVRCATKPCLDPEFFDTFGKAPANAPTTA